MRGDETGAVVRAGIGAAVAAVAVLHLEGWLLWPLDPLDHTMSDYVAVPGGYLLLGLAAGALALVGGYLTRAAAVAGVRPAATVLLGSWSAAMVVLGIFPTNAPGLPSDVISDVHRWAGAWAFASLPLAVVLLARGPAVHPARRPTVIRSAVLTGTLSVAFLLAHVPIVIGGSFTFPFLGGIERVLYGMVMVLLIVTARALLPTDLVRDMATDVERGTLQGAAPPAVAPEAEPAPGGAA